MAAPKFPSLFNVNLLIHKEKQEKLYSRLIKWALSSGRFIVIIVEMITIGAFIYRYTLDSDLETLQGKIKEQANYIKNLRGDETAINRVQFQLSSIAKLKSEQADFVTPLNDLAKIIPQAIKITNITFDRATNFPQTAISITGQTPSNLELSVFIAELQKTSDFSDINLTNISFDTQTMFTITGNLTGKNGATTGG